MTPTTWPCPLPGGSFAEEYALVCDAGADKRLLIVPALFDEANRMRRLSVEVMRRLERAGIDSFLVDMPGTNESLQRLETQGCEDWRDAIGAAARHFGTAHVLGIRGGCLFTPTDLTRWHYAPAKGPAILRQMIRARILASREAGTEETSDGLMKIGQTEGIELVGYGLGADFIEAFQSLKPAADAAIHQIGQDTIGGSGLWLRAEPGESREQADALAAVLAIGLQA